MKKSSFFILSIVLSCFLWTESSLAQNAITYWKDGIPTIIYSPDSIFFWSADNFTPIETDEGECADPTETEQHIMSLTSDEEEAPVITYSEEDSLRYDAIAQEVLAMFAPGSSSSSRRKVEGSDDMAEEIIRNNGNNIFEGLIIEQQDWDSGLWGKTRYGGFETFYGTSWENGKRCIIIVFYYKGGFPNKKTAYLKLGQVNSGKVVGKTIIYPGREYGVISVCIDDFLPGNGCVNFFPLLITAESQARNYLNPIFVKSDPIIARGWDKQSFGYEFGKINGVSVYFNNDTNKGNSNQGDGKYQCVELCKRYVKELNSNISRELTDTWGNAINWPSNRANDDKDPGKYIVYANDGSTRVREGDLIVWHYGKYGHIGVVIKTTENYISVAHQNGGTGTNALPIGSTLKIEGGIIKDIKPGTNKSPIFANSHPINYFIRMYHSSEDYASYSASMKASTTKMEFGEVEAGKSKTMTFKIKNSGTSTLTISSMTLTKGDAFSLDASSCTIGQGETRTFNVTFAPTKASEFKDRIFIQSNAEDNPQWTIHLFGTGTGGAALPTDGLVAYYPFNGNANDESGNGNHGTDLVGVTLTNGVNGDSEGAYQFGGFYNWSHIRIPNSESLQFSEGCSFSVYIKPTNWGGMDGWANYASEGNHCILGKKTDRIGMYCRYGGNEEGITAGSGCMNASWADIGTERVEGNYLNKWVHMAFVYGKTFACVYVNGELKAEKECTPDFGAMNGEDLFLGAFPMPGSWADWWYPMEGAMDELSVYNRALTGKEVRALYEKPMGINAAGGGGGSSW